MDKDEGGEEGRIKGRRRKVTDSSREWKERLHKNDRQTNEEETGEKKKRKKWGEIRGRVLFRIPPHTHTNTHTSYRPASATGSGWAPTIPLTLEVTWRKAALIKLTPGLRRMIAGSNVHTPPPLSSTIHITPHTPPIHINPLLLRYSSSTFICIPLLPLFLRLPPTPHHPSSFLPLCHKSVLFLLSVCRGLPLDLEPHAAY